MALLEIVGISVRFGGLSALDNVGIDVEAGSVTGLIGPNGAGKTTLFNVICGLQAADIGRVSLDGDDITGLKPYQRARLGIARTFQRIEIFGSLSVRDNIRVAADVYRGWQRLRDKPSDLVADEILGRVGLQSVSTERADALPTGMARLVEVGRALATRPRLLLLDEPSSGLDRDETDDLASLLRALADDGLGILLVEHDVDLVMRVSTTVYVLDFGRILTVGSPEEVRASAAVQKAYLGSASR